jgi:hypothetical protein
VAVDPDEAVVFIEQLVPAQERTFVLEVNLTVLLTAIALTCSAATKDKATTRTARDIRNVFLIFI